MAVNGIHEHAYRKLRDLAEQRCVELPSHGGTGWEAGTNFYVMSLNMLLSSKHSICAWPPTACCTSW